MSYTSLALSRAGAPRLAKLAARLNAPVVAAIATLALAWCGLVVTHKAAHVAVPKSIALHHVLANPGVAGMLASVGWNRVDLTPMDSRYEILGFYRGPRAVATVTVGFDRKVVILDATDLTRRSYQYGSNIANDLRVLALLAAVFILMCAVWPLWRIRNLDVLAVASLTLSVVLYNGQLLTRMVLVSYPVFAYLAIRCAWYGLGRRREHAPAIPLYEHLTRSWSVQQQVRLLRWMALALALITAMVGLTSLHVLDVGYAVMEGATTIVHGVLPYGHIPDVLHGDTYPIGSYLFYVPFALLWPVHNVWDDADATLFVAVAATLLATAGVARFGLRTRGQHLRERRGDASASRRLETLRLAIAWLAFPALLVTVSTGTNDVLLAAILVGVLLLWQRPASSSAALSAAAWFKLTPAVLLPLWLARLRGKSLARGALAVIVSSVVLSASLVALGGLDAPLRMVSAMGFQFTRSSPQTVWAIVGHVPLQQLAEAATLALIVGASIRLRRDDLLASDLHRLAAISGAVLLGVLISANYWNYMYLVWIVPFLLTSVLAGPEHPAR